MTTEVNRRNFVKTLLGGAVALSLAPTALAQYGSIPGKILLRFNENPYGPSPKGLKAAAEAAADGAYYPMQITGDLISAIAERNDLSTDHLVLSSGSNEALHAAMVAYGKRGKVVTASLTYTDHVAYSERMGVEFIRVPLAEDMSIDLEAMAAAVDDSVSLVYVCNPNNPTGLALDGDKLRNFCRTVSKKAVVLVDEAYNEITDDPDYTSVIDLVRDGENVVVMRTFSKIFGMAGYRVGYGLGHPEIVSLINGHVMAWPNIVGLATAYASYLDDEFIAFSRGKILAGRKLVNETFRSNGIEPLPSQTNFVYADIGRNAEEFATQMAARNVLIRGSVGGPDNFARVSMGKLEDIEVFSRVFTEVYNA
jgi:histidinol-phosphate aminotransferase